MKSKVVVKATYWIEDGVWIGRAVLHGGGANTQGRTLEVVKARMREAVCGFLDCGLHQVELVDEVKLPVTVRRMVRARGAAEARAREAGAKALQASRQAAKELLRMGLSYRDAGTILGVSRQRVEQIVREP
jgi:hypothetical protein